MTRRMTSRSVSLTTTFLLLASGGVAACDGDETQDEAFYCADENGVVVDEDYCDDDRAVGGVGFLPFFIWHSASYRPGYGVGTKLPAGGSRFAYNDAAARQRFGLPASGRISNGTVKTSVVGKGGGGTGKSSGKSGG
ncbi:MAG TPA: hypothetical protein VFH03_19590 [Actinoplanes sp.]|nr:hypothetical protein [Actinoplanes sp.]